MISLLVDVIASSLESRSLDIPVRFRELQFCALTVKGGASTAPRTVEQSSADNYLVKMESGRCHGLRKIVIRNI